jgi:hypothetical protein
MDRFRSVCQLAFGTVGATGVLGALWVGSARRGSRGSRGRAGPRHTQPQSSGSRVNGGIRAIRVPFQSVLHTGAGILGETCSRRWWRRGTEAKRQGVDADRARDAMLPEIAELTIRITGNIRGSNDAFKMQMVD